MVRVDSAQCALLARCLDGLDVRPDAFVLPAISEAGRFREANLWFALVAICQATRTLQGTIDGVWVRGWDYMVGAARRALVSDPGYFATANLVNLTADDLRALFSDDGVPAHSSLDRIGERLAQWHEAADRLLADYGGDVMNLYEAADRRVVGPGGILDRLSAFDAYSDPVQKKSFLLIMFCVQSGAWGIVDLDSLKVAIDYHVMRIAFRSGMVMVDDPSLEARLKEREPVSADEDNAVRSAIRDACDLLVKGSRHDVFAVDNILWMIGRNCCFYDYDPICGNHRCWRQKECSLLKGIDYDCPGLCLFDGTCRGSRDDAYRAYWETQLHTTYY